MTFTTDSAERLDQLFPEALHLWRLDRLYQDLNQACHQLTGRNLKPSEKACLRGLLCRYRPGQIAYQLNWTSGTLRVELNKGLYRFIELLADQPPNTLRWEKVGEWLAAYRQDQNQSVLSPSHLTGKLIDWGEAPEVSLFLGRQEEFSDLQRQILLDRCRLMAIWGMGGIGKTALAVKLVESLRSEFDRIIWRSLRHLQPLEQFLSDLYRSFAQKSEGELSVLLDLMRKHRYLLVLDDFEAILQEGELAGAYRPGYENYRDLLERCGQERHQSCLILLSREQPKEIAIMHGDSLYVRSLRLKGIQRQGAKELLKARGFSGSEKGVEELVQQYRGNPAALKIVATTIHEVFNGNISEFLNQTMLGMGDILLNLLYSQFERLSQVEKDVIYWLALKRRPTNLADLRRDLSSSGTEVINALESLRWRSLIEKSTETEQVCFLLEPVVMKYVNKKFVHECAREIERLVASQSLRQVRLLRSHILVEDYAPDAVRAVQIRLTLKPLKDHLLLELANQDLTVESLNRALSQSRELVGYTAANLALLGLWQ